MFLSRNKKNNVYPCKPQFYYIRVGFKGVKIIYVCFRDEDPHLTDIAPRIVVQSNKTEGLVFYVNTTERGFLSMKHSANLAIFTCLLSHQVQKGKSEVPYNMKGFSNISS